VLPWDAPLVRRVAAAPQAEDKFRGRPRGLGEDEAGNGLDEMDRKLGHISS
jgi:hypothetical protein